MCDSTVLGQKASLGSFTEQFLHSESSEQFSQERIPCRLLPDALVPTKHSCIKQLEKQARAFEDSPPRTLVLLKLVLNSEISDSRSMLILREFPPLLVFGDGSVSQHLL